MTAYLIEDEAMDKHAFVEARTFGLLDYPVQRDWDHDEAGEATYALFTCPLGKPLLQGLTTVACEAMNMDQKRLRVQTIRLGSDGYHSYYEQESVCQNDSLATPVQWVWETKLAKDREAEPYRYTGICAHGSVQDGMLTETIRGKRKVQQVAGPFTWKYNLFHAMEAHTAAFQTEVSFSLLEEMTVWRTGQRIRPYVADANCGSYRLNIYTHTGQGVVPALIGLDAAGRFLFYSSGMEVWFRLGDSNQAEGRWQSIHEQLRPHYR